MSHPELGRYGKSVLYGELAGTIGASILNATLSPTAAAVLKTVAGIALGWYGLQRLDENGVTTYQAGVRLLTSVVEQLSYPRESRAIMEDVQSKKPFYLRADEWKSATTGAKSVAYSPPPASTVSRVVMSQTYVPQPTQQTQQQVQKPPNIVEI
ncbi:MAG: hypothetical protein ACO2PN_29350 [Pyrobaculum sp.]|jgi:hypothetical protein